MSFGNIVSSTDIVKEKMEGVLGNIEVELDGRFRKIRTQETNLGKLNCWLVLVGVGLSRTPCALNDFILVFR